MKRTVPLLITAIAGFVLIISTFFPATESWGELFSIWFDVLAAIAFVLGGGNLLKIHLKKISDRARGWGYSAITLIAFLGTLIVGLWKVGTTPVPEQEFPGETFVSLPLAALPESATFEVEGSLPEGVTEESLPQSVSNQLTENNGNLNFRGWMGANQRSDLLNVHHSLKWKCAVETLAEKAQPPADLKNRLAYYPSYRALSYSGHMTQETRQQLQQMSDEELWQEAVNELYEKSQRETSILVNKEAIPDQFSIPDNLENSLILDRDQGTLTVKGPISASQRNAMQRSMKAFPPAMPERGANRALFLSEIEQEGKPLNEDQNAVFDKVMDSSWTAEALIAALNTAGQTKAPAKTYCELYAEQMALEEQNTGSPTALEPKQSSEETNSTLNPQQEAQLRDLMKNDSLNLPQIKAQLADVGTLTPAQEAALDGFFQSVPTVGERNRKLAFELLKHGRLSEGQRNLLFRDYRAQVLWQEDVQRLYEEAHSTKYAWSGAYDAPGTPFWWIYEYALKPLTATMFAMLAFYVASAAFRAFRAKNIEAILLLGTAFLILLGRTPMGAFLSDMLPEQMAFLKIERIEIFIMQVFNTAGNRAIMIGIALGVVSTSLKVLLGIDRSYLGSQDD